jgi:hypothetical protein
MAAMADDVAMVVPFLAAYGGRLAGVVRRHLRELGRAELAGDPDTVQGLVLDVALWLRDHAGSWRPDGSLPWTWAWSAIRALVIEHIGHARADVELEGLDDQWVAPTSPVGDLDLDELATRVPELALLFEALDRIGVGERDRRVHVEYRLQVAMGDPSPAHTVAAELGLHTDHVRQIDRRVRAKLQALSTQIARFAPLAEWPWVTGRASQHQPSVAA